MSKKRTDASEARHEQRRVCPFSCALLCMICATSVVSAREDSGELGLIIRPNIGRPALVEGGGSFKVVLREKADLALRSSDGAHALVVEWDRVERDRAYGVAVLPSSIAPGAYTLQASKDANPKAVHVFADFPQRYTFIHVAQPRIANEEDLATLIAETAKRSKAEFVLMTGDLTTQGAADEFRDLLELLGRLETPAFLCPGPSDNPHGQFQAFFGRPAYSFMFGEDAFLSLGALRSGRALDNGPGLLHRLRRQIKPARWSVGFTDGYRPDIDMRTQLALFVDTPLDAIVLGDTTETDADPVATTVIPWGKTSVHATGPVRQAGVKVVRVDATGLESIGEAQ